MAVSVSLPELVYLDVKTSFLPMPSIYFTQCVAHWNDSQETAYQIFILSTFYIVPFCAMIVLYGQIVYTLWWRALPQPSEVPSTPSATYYTSNGSALLVPSRARAPSGVYVNGRSLNNLIQPSSSMSAPTTLIDNQIRSRRKVAMMLIITVALFAFCYLPVHTLNILR